MSDATRFGSHTWHLPFVDLLDALNAHAAEAPDAEDEYFWIGTFVVGSQRAFGSRLCLTTDVFVSNQHKGSALDTSWFKDAFAQAITRIGHTLLVLQPWHAPLPLTRSWCLWEIFSTLDGGKELKIVLSPAQRADFQETLVRGKLTDAHVLQ